MLRHFRVFHGVHRVAKGPVLILGGIATLCYGLAGGHAFPADSAIGTVSDTDPAYVTFDGCSQSGSITSIDNPQYALNTGKNRFTKPASAPAVDINQMLASKSGSGAFDVTSGATVLGYVAAVKPEGKESCNCGRTDTDHTDFHIYLMPTAAAVQSYLNTGDKSQAVVVEISPRVKRLARANGFPWNDANSLSTLIGSKVRIQGWLLDDFMHKDVSKVDGATGRIDRGTCWEIHPITSIGVLQSDPAGLRPRFKARIKPDAKGGDGD